MKKFAILIVTIWLACMFASPVLADCDGKVTFTPEDAQAAFDKYMGTCTNCEDICCDVNKDGKCTPADVRCIARKAAGISPNCLDDAYTPFTSGNITGHVRGNGLPIAGARVEVGTASTTTDNLGDFTLSVTGAEISDTFDGEVFLLKVTAEGFATGYAKAARSDIENNFDIEIQILKITDEITEEENIAAGFDIMSYGVKLGELTIPSQAFPDGVTQITGAVTYLDPTTTEIDAAPGRDFRAILKTPDPEQPVISLNSFAMMDFDLKDQNGNPVSKLKGQATICMKIPASITVAAGDKIPLWWYNPEDGFWHEDGESTVESRADGFWASGQVSHFTWWNIDNPVSNHSCFRFTFKDEAANPETPVASLQWYAEGVSYIGTSRQIECKTCSSCRTTSLPLSFTVKINEQIKVYTIIKGVRYYLKDDGDGTFSVTTNKNEGTIIYTPNVNASCYRGYNISGCRNLDDTNRNGRDSAGAVADGILPFRVKNAINRAPDIRSLEWKCEDDLSNPGSLKFSATAKITEPEGDNVSVTWSLCGTGAGSQTPINPVSMTPSGSEKNVTSTFIRSELKDFCKLILTVKDMLGNTSTAFRYVWVGKVPPGNVAGRLYVDSYDTPTANAKLRLYKEDGTYNQTVTTDMSGFYLFEKVPSGPFIGTIEYTDVSSGKYTGAFNCYNTSQYCDTYIFFQSVDN